MVKDLLSQAEIDALLANVQTQDLRSDSDVVPARRFDLASRQQLKKRRLPGLEQINKRFAERFRDSISDVLGQGVDVVALELQFLPYSEYLHSLYVPTSLNLMRLHPLKGAAMLVFDARLVFRLVDMFFGGSGAQGSADGRDFSPVERRVIGRLVSRAHSDYQKAWQLAAEVQCEAIGVEVNPAMAAIAAQAETVVLCRFQIELEGGGRGEFHITLPQTMLEPMRDILAKSESAAQSVDDPVWQAALRESVLDLRVPTRCTIAEPTVSLRDVASMSVGDIIPLGVAQRSILKAGGVAMAKASLGVTNGQLALKIAE
ncbi:flagellar motor switch protein FliM [Zhongshania guokunii]|uniref:Flagellar motor switch protein FliM n=1 Tax=Zhongshania guokunii TaxID=641783 RepID=A0ABV3U5P0_9GAMM